MSHLNKLLSVSSKPVLNSIRVGSCLPRTLREILETKSSEHSIQAQGNDFVNISGWVRSIRDGKACMFLNVYDGSMKSDLQVVVDKSLFKETPELLKPTNGSSISVKGQIVPMKDNNFEFLACAAPVLLGTSNAAAYPIPKAKIPLSRLRNIHLFRARSKHFSRLLCLRSEIFNFMHTILLQEHGFILCNTPLITQHDCEGAGESFSVTSNQSPDFFSIGNGSPHLTVSGQLHLEIAASAISRVFTHGPCFRAEKSNSGRHLSEFWMLETEIAFLESLDALVDFAEQYFVGICRKVHEASSQSMEQLWNSSGESGLAQRQWQYTDFQGWMSKGCPVARITFDEAKAIVLDRGDAIDVETDLSREEEIKIIEHFNGPVFVTDWPASIKPFYMAKDGARQDRVKCFDLLIPNVGEIIGGSLREHDLKTLEQNIISAGMKSETLSWYLDLRKFGSAPHGGFGIGSDRLVQFLSGSASIHDVTFLPRSYKACPF